MKKDKKQKLTEALGELLLTFLCLGVGVLIVGAFGVDFESNDIEYDLIILLGVAVFLVTVMVVHAVVQGVKKIFISKNRKD